MKKPIDKLKQELIDFFKEFNESLEDCYAYESVVNSLSKKELLDEAYDVGILSYNERLTYE